MTRKSDPRSIDAYGLQQYLDGTRWRHNDNGYDEFVKLMAENRRDPRRVSLTEIGRHFNVDRRTIYNWVDRYQNERKSSGR